MIREELQCLIFNALGKELKLPLQEISLEHPENPEHGDYSTNVALVLAKKLGKAPREVAESILSKAKSQKLKVIEKVEAAGPGFINFFLSTSYLAKELGRVVREKEKYGTGEDKKKVIVEFTDPNPFKVFHLGHLYSNTVGESICRLFEARGDHVKRVNYQGDMGLHVAKAILGMKLALKYLPQSMPKEEDMPSKKAAWLGWCYSLGNGSDFHAQYINVPQGLEYFRRLIGERNQWVESGELEKINAIVYEQSGVATKLFSKGEIKHLYIKGRKWSLEYFETIYKRLGTKFDRYYFESEVEKVGFDIVEKGLKEGIFQKSQGAVIFPGGKYGLHDRVFISSQNLPTYEAKELGLAPTKYKDFKYDLSLIVTGNEITEYFKVVLEAMEKMYPELAEKTRHITHGMVRLPEGKMSSRIGNIITAEDLLDEVKLRVRNVMETSTNVLSKKDREKIAEVVAVGAVKYSRLRVNREKDVIFDFDKSLSLEGDSGPYLQYTYARCKSILRKSKSTESSLLHSSILLSRKLSRVKFAQEEMDLLRTLYRFPEVVKEAAEKFSPNLVAQFAFDLAQKYNLFYNTHRVLSPYGGSPAGRDAPTKQVRDFRLLLTTAVAQIIKNSLSLLGIGAPERM